MKKVTQSLVAAIALGSVGTVYAADATQWQQMSAGSEQTYAIKADGTLWAWGSAIYGELGNGSKTPQKVSTPTQIGTDTDWKFTAGGSGRAFFIKADGTLWSTGTAQGGVLGTNSTIAQLSPAQIGSDTDWAYVTTSNAGDNYDALAIKTDGTLWGWGKNDLGTLGIGSYSPKAVPTQVGSDTDWVSVAIGRNHTIAIKSDGSIWGCGEANNGALGDNSGFKSSFVKVAEPANWKSVYAIDNATYAIKEDGTLWAWGENIDNVLGIGENSATTISTPTQVTAITEKAISISGSQYARVVITGEGTTATKAYSWGYDYLGELGNGTGSEFGSTSYTVYTTPQAVKFEGAISIITVSSGQNFTAVLTTDGKLFGWGSNAWGQLGTFEPENKLGEYKTTPIEMAVEQEVVSDGVVFDAENIPASLSGIEKITLTGEWNTENLLKLITPIGNTKGILGFNYNTSLKVVDMSQATFAENTSLSTIFRNCSVLETIIFPETTVENIVSLNYAFTNDTQLSSINCDNFINVTDINDAFQRCTSMTSLNIVKWNNIETSEFAFEGCENLVSIALPGNFPIGDRCFASCYGLRLIDWSTYEGTTAPVINKSSSYEPFNNIDFLPSDKEQITIIVPEAAYESFSTDEYWKGFTIEKAQTPGAYTIDGDDIPASLADATSIALTGNWDTAKFAVLAKALGTATSITAANSVLVSIDMSAAEITENTNLKMTVPGALFGTVDKGVFQNFTALESVIMPAPEQAANFAAFTQAFQACSALKSIDLTGCTGITTDKYAFYNCSSLEKVILPATFPLESELFDRCEALRTIDWSAYAGTEAPSYSVNAMPSLDNVKGLTVIVPQAAYEAFLASPAWKNYTIVSTGLSGINEITVSENAARQVYNFSGQYITTLAPGEDTSTLPAGLYIIAGKKILVK